MRPFWAGFLCVAAALSTATPARAAPPVPASTLGIRTLDARTEQALQGVVAVASEHYYLTEFHASRTTCLRAVAKRLEPRGEAEILRLPAVDPAALETGPASETVLAGSARARRRARAARSDRGILPGRGTGTAVARTF